MSSRDQELVRSLGIPVAQVAVALERSRQTVNRGLAQERDYLRAIDLSKVLHTWRSSNASLYTLARSKICEIYPEIAEAVLDAASHGGSTAFSVDVPGEYWLISGDLVGFKTNLPACSKQLEKLFRLDTAQVKLFVTERDRIAAQRLARTFSDTGTRAIVCKSVDLQLVPTTLLRIDHSDNMDLFGVSDIGFLALSRQEASRLRLIAQDALYKDQLESVEAE